MRFWSLGSFVLVSVSVVVACSDDDAAKKSPSGGTAGGGSSAIAGEPSAEAGARAQIGGAGGGGGSAEVTTGGMETSAGGGESGGEGPVGGAAGAPGLVIRELPCEESMREDFPLVGGKVNEGAVTNQASGSGFLSRVDATSGGLVNAPMTSWVYLKVTRSGLQKVDLDDEQALTSLDWDIAAKRFSIRLNGGDGGPSEVAAAVLTKTEYDDVSAPPAAASFASDSFYDEECALQENALAAGAPQLRLDAYFRYDGCVIMTATPFVVRLVNGEHVKLEVTSFYGSGQETCNAEGQAGTEAGMFSWRWQYL